MVDPTAGDPQAEDPRPRPRTSGAWRSCLPLHHLLGRVQRAVGSVDPETTGSVGPGCYGAGVALYQDLQDLGRDVPPHDCTIDQCIMVLVVESVKAKRELKVSN